MREEIGGNYFQETHPQELFRECSVYRELVSIPEQLPWILEIAMRTALERSGVAVVVVPGEIFLADAPAGAARPPVWPRSSIIRPADTALAATSEALDAAGRVTILAGAGCAGAHRQLIDLAGALQAPIVHAFRGKEFVEYDNPYDVGMTGLIGFSSGYRAMEHCDTLVLLGTDFPYRPFYPAGVPVIQVDVRGEQIGRRVPVQIPLVGTVADTVDALLPLLKPKSDSAHLDLMTAHYRRARARLDKLADDRRNESPLHPQYVAATIDRLAAPDAIFTADVGTPCVWAARYLRMNGTRRLIGSFNHGSMANALPQAIGASEPAGPPGHQPVRRRRRRHAARRTAHAAPAASSGEGRGVQQRRTGLRGAGNEGRWHRHLRHRAGQPRLRRDRQVRRAVRRDRRQGRRTGGRAGSGVRPRRACPGRRPHGPPGTRLPPKLTFGQIKGFTLHATRTILSGGGEELVELTKTNLRQLAAERPEPTRASTVCSDLDRIPDKTGCCRADLTQSDLTVGLA